MKFLNSSWLATLSRVLLGALFVFSGLSKAINPFGLSIQFEEYFSALSLHFLEGFSPLFAVLLPAGETLLGLLLLGGLYRRTVSLIALVAMGFFTLLTLWIAIYNPVSDCGCFGDLWKISNWATFFKNVFFLVPSIISFKAGRKKSTKTPFSSLQVTLYTTLSLAMPLYATFNLPLIDATPYKIGVNIADELQKSAQSAPRQHTVLIYKNIATGKTQEFEVTDTTWYDSSKWEFVDTRVESIEDAPDGNSTINSFVALNSSGTDFSGELLSSPEVIIVATNDPKTIDWQWFNQLATDTRTVLMSSAPLEKIPEHIEAYNSDFTLIRTLIQHPLGGAILLREGEIVDKVVMGGRLSR